jgi:hypothetical protein
VAELSDVKVISIRQPWASMIAEGRKSIEVRKWKTNYRGAIYIHAARSVDWEAYEEFFNGVPFHMPLGYIIAKANLTEVRDYKKVHDFIADETRHLNSIERYPDGGCYGFVLKCIEKTKQVPLRGRLNIFETKLSI